jgi:hypothetical protein
MIYSDDESSQNLFDNHNQNEAVEKVKCDDDEDDRLSSSSAKRMKKNDEDEINHQSNNDNEKLLLEKFPFYGINKLVREKFNPYGEDPRGYDHPFGSDLPKDHCVHCKCRFPLCHDTRFGLYCGLRVAEQVEKKGAQGMYGDAVKELMKVAYNEILRVEICQQVGVLDTHNDYIPPKCMEDKSLKNIMNHFFYMKFTRAMKGRLEDGSKGSYGSGSYGFYSALREQSKKKP